MYIASNASPWGFSLLTTLTTFSKPFCLLSSYFLRFITYRRAPALNLAMHTPRPSLAGSCSAQVCIFKRRYFMLSTLFSRKYNEIACWDSPFWSCIPWIWFKYHILKSGWYQGLWRFFAKFVLDNIIDCKSYTTAESIRK